MQPGAVEEVRSKTLREQLGPVRAPLAPKARRPVRPR
jgi:hypothetical protein